MADNITWGAMLWCLLPLFIVACIYYAWRQPLSDVFIVSARMFVQLLAVGYVLVFIFRQPDPRITLLVVCVMMGAATWIAIRPVKQHSGVLLPGFIALSVAVSVHLVLSVALVIQLDTWYQPNVVIPLAGMFFANTMNAISLCTERYFAELTHQPDPVLARNRAFSASMIPQVNSLLAVGLVALPGMMTGQILSGVSPLIAVKYQILIMTMLFGATGLGSALMLFLLAKRQAAL